MANLAAIGVWVLNTAVVVGVTGGQSLGKRLAGTRIVHDSGTRVGFGTGLLRDSVCRLLFVIPLVGLIDALMPLGQDHQSMRDKMASTRVLREPVYRSRRWLVTTAAVLVTGTWVALTIVGNTWDEASSAELGGGYQAIDRDTFISGCRDEGGGENVRLRIRLHQGSAVVRRVRGGRHRGHEQVAPRTRRVIADAFTKCEGAGGEDPAIGA